jgi:hypothetical protein
LEIRVNARFVAALYLYQFNNSTYVPLILAAHTFDLSRYITVDFASLELVFEAEWHFYFIVAKGVRAIYGIALMISLER